jgi:8-oxo-dGTP pyrophosphatase MutT (NUDIX family)
VQYERSCGGVVFTRQNGTVYYVIIRHLGGHCGFPKGHMEPGETQRQTALREIREEVGLDCVLMDGFCEEEWYSLPERSGLQKQVVYFLAQYADQTLSAQPQEVAEVYLLPYAQALEKLTFVEARQILQKANDFLTV